MSRREDLEQSIRESYDIIREYEAVLRTGDRPEEQLRASRQIDQQWALIGRYGREYIRLAGEDVSPEIAEILARFGWGTPEPAWPMNTDVPLLDFHQVLEPRPGIPSKGIRFTDKVPDDVHAPPRLSLSVFFKVSPLFIDYVPLDKQKWLYIEGSMLSIFSLRIQVRAYSQREINELMWILSKADRYLPPHIRGARESYPQHMKQRLQRGWSLSGPRPDGRRYESGDYFRVWQAGGENRITVSTFTATNAAISIHARFTDQVGRAFAEYLENAGFTVPFVESR